MWGRARLATVASRNARLVPSTVASSAHRPVAVLSRSWGTRPRYVVRRTKVGGADEGRLSGLSGRAGAAVERGSAAKRAQRRGPSASRRWDGAPPASSRVRTPSTTRALGYTYSRVSGMANAIPMAYGTRLAVMLAATSPKTPGAAARASRSRSTVRRAPTAIRRATAGLAPTGTGRTVDPTLGIRT